MDIIDINPDICFAKQRIKGTRMTVGFILGLLGANCTMEYILDAYDHITEQDVLACLTYASKVLENLGIYGNERKF